MNRIYSNWNLFSLYQNTKSEAEKSLKLRNYCIVADKYNDNKTWIIDKSKSNHYYLSEYICGQKYGKKQRLGKKYIFNMLFE